MSSPLDASANSYNPFALSTPANSSSSKPIKWSHSKSENTQPDFFQRVQNSLKPAKRSHVEYSLLYYPSNGLEKYGIDPSASVSLKPTDILNPKFIKEHVTGGYEYSAFSSSYIDGAVQLFLVRNQWKNNNEESVLSQQQTQLESSELSPESRGVINCLTQLFAGPEIVDIDYRELFCVLVFHKEFLRACEGEAEKHLWTHASSHRPTNPLLSQYEKLHPVIRKLLMTRVLHVCAPAANESSLEHHTMVTSLRNIQTVSQLSAYLTDNVPKQSRTPSNQPSNPDVHIPSYEIFHQLPSPDKRIKKSSSQFWNSLLLQPFISLYLLDINEKKQRVYRNVKFSNFLKSSNITDLDLSNVGLTDEIVENEINWAVQALKCNKLNLSNNELRRVPAAIFECQQLREIDLSHNQINDIDVTLAGRGMHKKNCVSLDLSYNKLKRLRFDSTHPWLSSVEKLDLRWNPDLEDLPNNLVLWLLEEHRTLLADIPIEPKNAPTETEDITTTKLPTPFMIRELNFFPEVSCYMCSQRHKLYMSEIRTIDIPTKKPSDSEAKRSWFEYGSFEDSTTSVDTCSVRISSVICRKCWKKCAKNLKVKKFCWKCMDFRRSSDHKCLKEFEHHQVQQNLLPSQQSSPKSELSHSSGSSHEFNQPSSRPQQQAPAQPTPHTSRPVRPPVTPKPQPTPPSRVPTNYPSTSHTTHKNFSSVDDDQSDKDSKFRCDLCDVVCTSQETLDYHIQGKKHQHKLEVKRNTTYCPLCDVSATNVHGYKMHIQGAKHSRKYKILRYCIQLPNGKLGLLQQLTTSDGSTQFLYIEPETNIKYDFHLVSKNNKTILHTSTPLCGRTEYNLYKEKHGKILGLPEV